MSIAAATGALSGAAGGARALAQLFQTIRGQGSSQSGGTGQSGSTSDPFSAFAPPSSGGSSQPVSLTASQPPSDQSAISEAASKLIADFKSLLLNAQAGNSGTPSGSATSGAATTATASASPATTATAATGATDPADTLANDLQTLSNDLQKAGGGHHRHHHGGGGGGDLLNATSPTAVAGTTGGSTTGGSTTGSTTGSGPSAGQLAQFTQALNAYTAANNTGSKSSASLSSSLLTA